MELSVADVLRGAIDVLAERGWYQGDYTPNWEVNTGPVCAAGAIAVACGARAQDACDLHDELRLLALRIAAMDYAIADTASNAPLVVISAWNDDPTRTYEDVVLEFKHAVADAEAAS